MVWYMRKRCLYHTQAMQRKQRGYLRKEAEIGIAARDFTTYVEYANSISVEGTERERECAMPALKNDPYCQPRLIGGNYGPKVR